MNTPFIELMESIGELPLAEMTEKQMFRLMPSLPEFFKIFLEWRWLLEHAKSDRSLISRLKQKDAQMREAFQKVAPPGEKVELAPLKLPMPTIRLEVDESDIDLEALKTSKEAQTELAINAIAKKDWEYSELQAHVQHLREHVEEYPESRPILEAMEQQLEKRRKGLS